jgi:hypothetical protein
MSIFQKNSENIFLKLCSHFVNTYFVMINANKIYILFFKGIPQFLKWQKVGKKLKKNKF